MRTVPTSLIFFSRQPPRSPLPCPIVSSSARSTPYQPLLFNQTRHFLKSSTFDGLFGTTIPLRQLTHTRVLPYPRSSVFEAIASVERYPSFLPFVLSAKVSQKDRNERPARASLKVGYAAFGIEEIWDSIVGADEEHGIIEARSADTSNEGGLFEVLKTKWQMHDLEDIRRHGEGVSAQTAVRLDVEVKFRSAIYDKVFAGVEEKVAGMMVGAFEKRIKELAAS